MRFGDPGARRHAALCATVTVLALALLCLASVGCGKTTPGSENYFGLVEGNRWLYEGAEEGGHVSVEIALVEPDPSQGLRAGVLDLAIEGSLGSFSVSEQGLFLEVSPDEVKLWGVQQTGAPPTFFPSPYVWLRRPLQVGQQYNTAIQGTPSPTLMVVTSTRTEQTPWGPFEAFVLEEKSGSGPAAAVRLAFVPNLGFTTIEVPGQPALEITDASLR